MGTDDNTGTDVKEEAANVSVYVVEDSPVIVNLLTELIETTGAHVVGHANTAAKAVEEIAALHPDVVTIDISLKRGTGFDVLESIAINSDERPPTRIMVTNLMADAYRQAARQLGAEYFFDKARQIGELLKALASVARQRRLQLT